MELKNLLKTYKIGFVYKDDEKYYFLISNEGLNQKLELYNLALDLKFLLRDEFDYLLTFYKDSESNTVSEIYGVTHRRMKIKFKDIALSNNNEILYEDMKRFAELTKITP